MFNYTIPVQHILVYKEMCSGALTLQLLEQEGFAAAPLSVQTHADGWLHGGLAKDVSQRTAVQVITQHVAVTLRRGQVLYNTSGEEKRKQKTSESLFSFNQKAKERFVQMRVRKTLTGTKDLGEDAFLVRAVDVVGRLALLVGLVE